MNITFEMLKNNIPVLVVFWYSCDNVTLILVNLSIEFGIVRL